MKDNSLEFSNVRLQSRYSLHGWIIPSIDPLEIVPNNPKKQKMPKHDVARPIALGVATTRFAVAKRRCCPG